MSSSEAESKMFQKEHLTVRVYGNIMDMGACAAQEIARTIKVKLAEKQEVNMIFAAAPSQEEMLKELIACPGIDWERINAFHMDEYIGLGSDSPAGFGNFLRQRIFGKLPFKSVNYINGLAPDPEVECERYSKLLNDYPVDIVCLGIGENGHIAFNDPDVADFNDPKMVKVVALDEVCRQQQVNEKCFPDFDSVPTHAFTLTVPALMRADRMICVVPFKGKAKAVRRALTGEISEECPSSILRTKPNAVLYLDSDSSSLLDI